MEFQAQRSRLLHAITSAYSVAGKKALLPIMSHTLIRATGDEVTLGATDGEVSCLARVKARVVHGGEIALKADGLRDAVRSLPTEDVSIRVVDGNRAEIRSGNSRMRVMGLSSSDFPRLPVPGGAEMVAFDRAALVSLIKRSSYAASDDCSARPVLCGVYFEQTDSGTRATAMNGRVGAFASVSARIPFGNVVVPIRAISEIARLMEGDVPCAMEVSGGHLFVSAGDVRVASKLIDGEYPYGYDSVSKILKPDFTVEIDRAALVAALRRVGLFTSRDERIGVTVENGSIRVDAVDPDRGDASEAIDIDHSGERAVCGVSCRLLLDTLSPIDAGVVILGMTADECSPITVRLKDDDTYIAVLGKMRMM